MREAEEHIGHQERCTHHRHQGWQQMLQCPPALLALLLSLLQAPKLRLHPQHRQLGRHRPRPTLMRHVSCRGLHSTAAGDEAQANRNNASKHVLQMREDVPFSVTRYCLSAGKNGTASFPSAPLLYTIRSSGEFAQKIGHTCRLSHHLQDPTALTS
jgi:hypothetical protein